MLPCQEGRDLLIRGFHLGVEVKFPGSVASGVPSPALIGRGSLGTCLGPEVVCTGLCFLSLVRVFQMLR